MPVLTNESISQGRIGDLITKVDMIISSPLVDHALENSGLSSDSDIGWGMKEYRAGEGFLSGRPSQKGEVPAEIAYYPEIPSLGVMGAIYCHGPASHRLEEGKLASFHFDDRIEDGNYVGQLEIRLQNGELQIGRPEPKKGVSGDLIPARAEDLHTAEVNLGLLLDYIEAQQAA